MATRPSRYTGLGILALATLLHACDKPAPPPPAPAKTPGVISFAADSPELNSVQTTIVGESALPISADLNARLGVDESVTSRVGSPVAGRVLRVVADLGQPVRTGQVLATLDAPDLGQARADMAKAQADANLKARALQRANTLFSGDAIARQDVESAQADAAAARAELQRSQLRVSNLGSGQGDTLALTSAVSGYVIDRQINPGQQVAAGQSPLFTVTDPHRLWLYVDVPETAASRTRMGEDIQFDVPAWPGRRFHGKVTDVGLAVDPTTRRVQLRAAVSNPDLALKPEMYARANLVTDDGRRAIAVPNGALFEQGLKSFVFRVDAPGRFRRVPVTVGERGDSMSYITDGVKTGDRIVSEGALLLNAQLEGN